MKIEQTRKERFKLLREQIKREIELDQAILYEEELIANYLERFSAIDNEYFADFLEEIKNDWDLLNLQLHQDRRNELMNSDTRYEINQYLHDIKNKYDYNIGENVNLEKILEEHKNEQNYQQHLITNEQINKYQEIIKMIENTTKELQAKITAESEHVQNAIKENFLQNSKQVQESNTPVIEMLSATTLKTDEQFNRLANKFKTKKFALKTIFVILLVTVSLLVIALIVLTVILKIHV